MTSKTFIITETSVHKHASGTQRTCTTPVPLAAIIVSQGTHTRRPSVPAAYRLAVAVCRSAFTVQ